MPQRHGGQHFLDHRGQQIRRMAMGALHAQSSAGQQPRPQYTTSAPHILRRGFSSMAKAYWISCYCKVLDPNKLAAYAKLAGPGDRGGWRSLPRPGHRRPRRYEDGLAERTVLIEFDVGGEGTRHSRQPRLPGGARRARWRRDPRHADRSRRCDAALQQLLISSRSTYTH